MRETSNLADEKNRELVEEKQGEDVSLSNYSSFVTRRCYLTVAKVQARLRQACIDGELYAYCRSSKSEMNVLFLRANTIGNE